MKFLEPTRNPKVIYTDNSLEFGKACEDLSWNHCTSTPHRSETNGIAERAVRRVKEGTCAVLLQSGLDEKWWADSMECYTYLRNIQDLLSDGKTPYERRFGVPFNGQVIPWSNGRMSSSTSRQDSSWYDGEARNGFWSISGNFIYRHHVEHRVKLYVPRENSFPSPLKYIDVTRTTDTVHRAPLPEPIQSTSSANEPLSRVNYESGRNPRMRQFLEVLWKTSINCTMHRENLENKIDKLQLLKKWRNLDRLGHKAFSITRWQRRHLLRRCPTSSPRCTSMSPWKALRTLISKMGELQKLLTSPLYAQRASGKPDAMVVQEREVSAQTSHSLKDHRDSGKPAALFSPKRNEQRNQMWSSVFGHANLSNLSGTLLEGNKDHLLNRARTDPARREIHVESLNKCIGVLQKRTEAQNRALQDVQNEFVESRREQTR